AAGFARINFDTTTFSSDLNDLTTGPLKIDTAARNQNNYFITFDMGAVANPQMTLGVQISSVTFIGIDPPAIASGTNIPASSILRTIIPSPQTLNVNAQYYFSNTSGSFPLPRLLAAVPSGPGVTAFTLDTTTGLPSAGNLVVNSEIISYSSITLNVVT